MTNEEARRNKTRENLSWNGWRIWTVVGFIQIVTSFIMMTFSFVFDNGGRQFYQFVLIYWPVFVTRAGTVPLIFILCARLQLKRTTWASIWPVHFFLALVYPLLHVTLTVVLGEILGSPSLALSFSETQSLTLPFLTGIRLSLRSASFHTDVLWYWGTVGVFYAFYFYFDAQRNRLSAARLEASLMEAQLQALRSQLNPHFLFNTLNTVSVLALQGDRLAVARMLERLSDLLRITLDDTRPESIPLREEMEFIDGELEIEQIRLADRLTIHREIAPNALDALVPAMILQPVVENAIKYGVSAQTGLWTISILASQQNGRLRLQVCDNGSGFQSGTSRPPRKGIGLASTETRLEYLYGGAHTIEYGHKSDGGSSVTISIPFSQAGVMPEVGVQETPLLKRATR